MIKYLVAALCLLVPVAALAQGSKQSGADLPRFTVGTLPTTCTADRDLVLVTDADSAGNCALGSGTALAICGCNSTGTGFESTSGTSTSGTLPVTDDVSMAEGDVDDTKEVRFEVDGLTTGTTRVLTVPDEDIDLHDSQTDHEERYGVFNILDYGAVNDAMGVTDDTDAIMAAYDACSAWVGASGNGGSAYVFIPPGDWEISDTAPDDGIGLLLDGPDVCSFKGVNVGASSLRWNDATNNTDLMFFIDVSVTGQLFFQMENLDLQGAGANYPGEYINTDMAPDKYSVFRNLKLAEAGIAQMHFASGFINLQMQQMRFDVRNGWGIIVDVPAGNFLRSFSITDFTADLNSDPTGFIQFDDITTANTHAAVMLSNGRIEGNAGGFTNGRILEASSPGNTEYVMSLSNVTVDMGTSDGECLFGYAKDDSTPTGGTGYEATIVGSYVSLDQMLCGDWGTTYMCVDLFDTGGPPQTSGNPDELCDSDGATDKHGSNAGVTSFWSNQVAPLCVGSGQLCLRWDNITAPGCLFFDTNGDSVCDAGEELGGCSCT